MTRSLTISMVLAVATALAAEPDRGLTTLLEKTGVRGGLCLVLGAPDTTPTRELAAGSALYVQALQPDAEVALQWGAEFAAQSCRERERLGVRCAAFNPGHYGSDLFNLIVDVDEETGAAVARSHFTVFQALEDFPLQAIIAGRYHDRFLRVDGSWRFQEREIVPELYGDLCISCWRSRASASGRGGGPWPSS